MIPKITRLRYPLRLASYQDFTAVDRDKCIQITVREIVMVFAPPESVSIVPRRKEISAARVRILAHLEMTYVVAARTGHMLVLSRKIDKLSIASLPVIMSIATDQVLQA